MTLGEWFDRMRDEAVAEAVEEAVDKAVTEAVAEATERATEKANEAAKKEREKAEKKALAEGRTETLKSILSDLGEIPDEVQEQLGKLDFTTLKEWTKLAAKADSMQKFLEDIQKWQK